MNGDTHKGVVQLNVNPCVTTGATADGLAVATFKAQVGNQVTNLALSPDGTALYLGGQFTSADSTTTFATGTPVRRRGPDHRQRDRRIARGRGPAWINYADGDSSYSVVVSRGVVYVCGHNRRVNNYCGNNSVCEPNALLANGLAALDASTGLGLPWWHPQTTRGFGTMYLNTFTAGIYDGTHLGLVLGTDVDVVGGPTTARTQFSRWPPPPPPSPAARSGRDCSTRSTHPARARRCASMTRATAQPGHSRRAGELRQ